MKKDKKQIQNIKFYLKNKNKKLEMNNNNMRKK